MKENGFVSWIRKHPVWSSAFALLLFVVGIPVLINLCYSCAHVFYVTQWGAEDVLAYYGTILGAAIAAISLVITIRFTRKQIERESFIKIETEKWNRAENVIEQALIDISPMNIRVYIDNPYRYDQDILNSIQSEAKYIANANASLSRIKVYLNPDDYRLIEPLANEIMKAIKVYCAIADEMCAPRLEYLTYWEQDKPIPEEVMDRINSSYEHSLQKIYDEHAGSYQRLFNLKREVFHRIYQSINARADQKLKLFNGSVDECQPSNGSEKRK